MKLKIIKKGFTLVEVMVSVAVIGAVMSLVFFDGRTFNNNFSVVSNAKDLILATRQAQSYGVSVREQSAGTSQFSYAYGIMFDKNDTNAYIFVDKNGNRRYDGDSQCLSSGECVEKIVIRDGVYVSNICGMLSGGSSFTCASNTRQAHIVYVRPLTDAGITLTNLDSSVDSSVYSRVRISLVGPLGKTVNISINVTGQITLE